MPINGKKKIVAPLQLTGFKYKYSCRLDKAVKTDKDYIEELEMRFEESADIWKLTNEVIYGFDGYIVQMGALKQQVKKLEAELYLIKKFLEEAKRKTNRDFNE
tara:strand:+ start:392 stop:700 length:309 start_codon:yes stop_codon:yes gene_type:complete